MAKWLQDRCTCNAQDIVQGQLYGQLVAAHVQVGVGPVPADDRAILIPLPSGLYTERFVGAVCLMKAAHGESPAMTATLLTTGVGQG